MAKYREPDVTQWRFVKVNFSKLFPEDHPLSQLLAMIRKLDLSEFDAGYRNDTPAGGRPAAPCERKDKSGRVIGFEKLNYSLPAKEHLKFAFETVEM